MTLSLTARRAMRLSAVTGGVVVMCGVWAVSGSYLAGVSAAATTAAFTVCVTAAFTTGPV